MNWDHQISTHRSHASKFTEPSCSSFVIFSNRRIPLECHAKLSHMLDWMHTWKSLACSLESSRNAGIYFAQQKSEPAEKPSFGSGECQSFSARKAALRTGLQYTDVVVCGLRILHTMQCRPTLGQGCEEPSISIITRGSSPSLLAPMVTLGTGDAL